MISHEELREYFRKITLARNMKMDFDRFRFDEIVSDGLKLHLDVIEVGRGKPTMVFVPGTAVYALLYGEFLCAIADNGYNVVGFDPRGHGQSQGARGSYTVAELVRDSRAAVRYARDRFGEGIAVVGSSQGGIAAFYLAATDEKVAGVICHNIADLGDPSSVRLTRMPNFSRVFKPMLKLFNAVMPEFKIPISMYLDLEKEEMKGYGNAKKFLDADPLALKHISLKALTSLAYEKLAKPVEQILTPVMVLHAGADNIFPQDYIEDIFNRLTCKKSLKVYPNLQHLILTEHIDVVLPDALSWLKEIGL